LGCDVQTLARIAGHGSIAMSYRYVHPSEDRMLNAMEMLGGHIKNNEFHEGTLDLPASTEILAVTVTLPLSVGNPC